MQTTGLILMSVLFAGAFGLNVKSVSDDDHKPQRHKPVADSDPNNKPVMYCVIMGKLAYRHQVSLWLSSLRKIGGFKDEAVIVTDKPSCLAKTMVEVGLLGEQISSNENVDIYKPGEGYTGNIHVVKRPTVKSINKMKLEKARAWRNLEVAEIPHRVSSILYTDEDVVIAKPLTEFIGVIRELEKAKHTLALFRDTGLSAGELHTGIVVIFPGKKTEECLQAWGKKLTGVTIGTTEAAKLKVHTDVEEDAEEEIQENQLLKEEMEAMGPDQQALHGTKVCRKSPDHDGIKILPKQYFWLPTTGGMKKKKEVEFVHFTNTGRWKRISNSAIKKYLVDIGVPDHIDPLGSVKDKACATEESEIHLTA